MGTLIFLSKQDYFIDLPNSTRYSNKCFFPWCVLNLEYADLIAAYSGVDTFFRSRYWYLTPVVINSELSYQRRLSVFHFVSQRVGKPCNRKELFVFSSAAELCVRGITQLIPKDMQEPHLDDGVLPRKSAMVLGSLVRPHTKRRKREPLSVGEGLITSQNHWIRGAEGSTPCTLPQTLKRWEGCLGCHTPVEGHTSHKHITAFYQGWGGEGQVRAAGRVNGRQRIPLPERVLLHSKGHEQISDLQERD